MRGPLALMLATLLCGPGCAFRPIESNPLSGEINIEDEREMTAKIHGEIRAQMPFVTDPVILAYLNDIGQNIVRTTEPQPFIYRFFLIDSNQLNAFTIGGGYVYLASSVLAQAGDINEFSGVIAHEIAHVRRRHIAKAQENQGIATLATLAAAIAVVAAGGDPGIAMVAQGINVSLQLKHSRENESDADHHGIRYMIRAGYDPHGMIRFFQRILTEQRPGQSIPPYLYTHPGLKERIAAVRTQLARIHIPLQNRSAHDPRLMEMQKRLAVALQPVAGGSGLHTRPDFDRTKTDPLLREARESWEKQDYAAAEVALARAETIESQDPRIALGRATIAEAQGKPEQARKHLERAFELDPTVPLVQYRLGLVHKQLGNRSQAVFYLEQAATNFKPNSSGRRRAEFQIRQLSFNVLEASRLSNSNSSDPKDAFSPGETVVWRGRISRQFMPFNPRFRIRWSDPSGRVVRDDIVLMSPMGSVSSRLDLGDASPGLWTVDVSADESPVDRRTFRVLEPSASPRGSS